MKTKKIFNFLLLLGFLSGCDYLDIVPDNLPTLEMAFNNKSSAERFLFTCYSLFRNMVRLEPTRGWM